MNKEQFITQYVATFIANYHTHLLYIDCLDDLERYEDNYNNPPVFLAYKLAEKAWNLYSILL